MKKYLLTGTLLAGMLSGFFTTVPAIADTSTRTPATHSSTPTAPGSPELGTVDPEITLGSEAPVPAPGAEEPSSAPNTSVPAPSEPAAPEVTEAPSPTAAAPSDPAGSVPTEAPSPTAAAAPTASATATAPTAAGVIASKWNSLGGAGGPLGAVLDVEKPWGGYIYQEFTQGVIFSNGTLAGTYHLVKSSVIGKAWYGAGKAPINTLGVAISNPINDNGATYQKFSTGAWVFTNGYVLHTGGAIGRKWVAGGSVKILGIPTSQEICAPKSHGNKVIGCFQAFSKGTRIFWSSKTGTWITNGAIGAVYGTGIKDPLGYPTAAENCGLYAGGCKQVFEGGAIWWNSKTGTYKTAGAIGGYFTSAGNVASALRYPVGAEQCGQPGAGCSQKFQGGSIYWSPKSGTKKILNGKIMDGFTRRGSVAGMGWPLADQVCHQPNGGCFQDFQKGRLWSNNAHASSYKTTGAIQGSYLAKSGPKGQLGYPISDEKCSGGQCVQTFVRGHIGWGSNAASGVYAMTECQNLNNGKSRYSTGGANRVLLTFTSAYRQSHATVIYCKKIAGIYVTDWKTDGYVGTQGFKAPGVASGPTRYEYSPTGAFTVTQAFGLGNPGTKLPYRVLNPRSRWGGNPWTPTYNKYHESTSWTGYDENMWYFATRPTQDYRQGAVINYNLPTITQDAGFAIFLHQNKVPTAGCISVDDWAMVDFLRKATPGDRVIMGVKSALFK